MPSVSHSAAVAALANASRPPVSLTRLVGRAKELEELRDLHAAHRLVTLTGFGGSGKTRLAAELSSGEAKRPPAFAVWVELGSTNDPKSVAPQTAAAFSLRETGGRAEEALIEFLRDREVVVVLDNCEHLIDACAQLASSLLTHCHDLKIIATSREPLGIAGEQVWPVPPLSIPQAGSLDADAVAGNAAVELFVERAQAVDPSFRLSDENVTAVVEICRRLDGIPLAIELAAARVRLLTPEQIAVRLEDRFALLSGGPRSAAARHRTLRATLDWSFALLDERERTLMQRLAVFSGTFSLEQVEAVCADEDLRAAEILDLLASLVDQSLVVSTIRGTKVRYYLLETIARYCAERMNATADVHELRRRHGRAFLEIARTAVPELMNASPAALAACDLDRDNTCAALAWGIENEPDQIGLPLAAALRWYWYYRIRWSEGVGCLDRALQKSSPELTHDRISALTGSATLRFYLGDIAVARDALLRSEMLWREAGDHRQLVLTLSALAQLLATAGEIEAAGKHATEALALARQNGFEWDLAYALTNAAAFVAQIRGELDEADRYLAEAEELWSASHHPLGLPFVRNARGLVALRRKDHTAAAAFARAALADAREANELWFIARSLRIIAFTSANDPLRAARLLGAAASMLQTMTAGMLLHEKSAHAELLTRLNEKLTPDVVAEAMKEGSRLSVPDACALALAAAFEEPAVAAAPPSATAALEIRDLGPLQLSLGGQPLNGDGRASARARELLLFLAAHPAGKTKDEAGLALWPDASAEQVKNSFHVTLHRLRKLLGPVDIIVSEGGRYRIDPAYPHQIASRRFETAMTNALRSSHSTIECFESALAIYEGDYLEGEDAGEWSFPLRTQLRQLFVRGAFALGQRLEAGGRLDDAAEAYARITACEPFHEAAWRQLMICRARLGSRSDSLLLYRDLEQRLRSELETTPEPETAALYRRLQQNESV